MKTNDHNKQFFRDMQEEPDKYSDQEIEAMMDDLDQVPDVDEAWQQFARQHIPSVRPMHAWRKVAAVLIGVLTLSGIAIAAVWSLTPGPSPKEREVYSSTAEDSVSKPKHSPLLGRETGGEASYVFDNVTLDSIAKDIAAYHHLDIDLQNGQASELRFYFVWNQDESLQEVIEKLNMFEQVNLAVEDRKLIVR